MKLVVTIISLLILSSTAAGQDVPMYLKQRTPPPTVLLMADSTTKWHLKANYQKGKKLFIIFFSTDCNHCQHETEELVKNIDKFKDVQIVMATTKSLTEIKAFTEQYGLAKYKNITVGRDFAYTMPPYYEMKSLPYLAFYDKNKKLISTFEGTLGMDKVAAILK